jgi:hypothetical protein
MPERRRQGRVGRADASASAGYGIAGPQGVEGIMARMRLRAAGMVAALVALLISGGAWWKY